MRLPRPPHPARLPLPFRPFQLVLPFGRHGACRRLGALCLAGMATLGTLAVLAFGAPRASAQRPIGLADRNLVNPTGKGSKTIPCSIVYPATVSGVDTPIDPRPGGRACIVFLHGFGRWGAEYYNLAMALAQQGFVTVLPNSGQFSLDELYADAIAMRDSITLATTTRGHLFEGKLDLTRMGLVGHSYGGTTCARVLARNDGYRAGIAIAPVFVDDTVRNARVPFLVLHGSGDTLIPWRDGDKVYRAATSYRDVKAFLRLGTTAQHLNVAGMELANAKDEAIWSICADALTGFLLRFVEDEVDALAATLGPDVRHHPHVDDLRTEIDEPQVLGLEAARSAKSFRVAILAEPGPYGLALGVSRTRLSTPFGELGLDPATLLVIAIGTTSTSKLTELVLDTPSDPRFIGHDFGLQALATRARVGLRLSPPVWITIRP